MGRIRDKFEEIADKSIHDEKHKVREFHSRSYHRFFEGYSEQYKIDDKGNEYIDRVYVGDYYIPHETEEEQKKDKITGLVLYLITVALYVYCCIQRVWYNAFVPVEFFEVITLILLFWFLFPLVTHLRAKGKLLIRQYRDSSDLYQKGSCATAYCIWLLALAFIISAVVFREQMAEGIFLALLLGIAGGAMYLIHLKEKNRDYDVISADERTKKTGYTIEY